MLRALVEAFEAGRFVAEANIQRYRRILADAPGEIIRGQVETLLNEEQARLAAGQVAQWNAQLAIFAELLDEAVAVTGADLGNLQVVDPATGALRIVANRGFDVSFLNFFAVVRNDGDSACGAALKHAGCVMVPDVDQSPIFAGKPSGQVLRAAGIRAVQSTPILGRTDSLIGMISTHWYAACMPSDYQQKRLDLMIPSVAAAIEAVLARTAPGI